MKKVMISQPMAGRTEEEIVNQRDRAKAVLEREGYEFVNIPLTDEWYSDESMKKRGVRQIPLCYLAKSVENMSLCDAVYFCKGWIDARGCCIEREIAEKYGLEIIYGEV